MRKIDLLIGVLIGFLATFLAVCLFFQFYSNHGFTTAIKEMQQQGLLGKVITLGAILNIIIFFILLKLNKELMARGVVLSVILLAIITFLV